MMVVSAEMTVESETAVKRALILEEELVTTKDTGTTYNSVSAQADGGQSIGNIPLEGGHWFERGRYLMGLSTRLWRSPRKVT